MKLKRHLLSIMYSLACLALCWWVTGGITGVKFWSAYAALMAGNILGYAEGTFVSDLAWEKELRQVLRRVQ